MSDEDSADEMDEDCKLLNGDVSGNRVRGPGKRPSSLLCLQVAGHTLSLMPLGAPPCSIPTGHQP